MINKIKENKEIKKFIKEHDLSDAIIQNNMSVFTKFLDSYNACLKCDGKKCISNTEDVMCTLEKGENYIYNSYIDCTKKVITKVGQLEVLNYTSPNVDLEMNQTRYELLMYFDKFLNQYKTNDFVKGIYLHGKTGVGKSLLMYQFAKLLVSNGVDVIFAYYPDLVRQMQSNFDNLEELVYKLKTCSILMIDDIGREYNTAYIRDEVLGPILQYRCDNNLSIFITSNRNYLLLEEHLSDSNNGIDKIKARALIERIKFLTFEYELKDKDYRN